MRVERDGNGWVRCGLGHTHWGIHGAAGLLLHTVDQAGEVRALLQHRATWSHHGDTWGLPGGARDSHEDVVTTALREAGEEAGLPVVPRTRHTFVDDHGGWSYTTVYADLPAPVTTTSDAESLALEWVHLDEVVRRRLHPGFARTWARVRPEPVRLLVDTANVLGARPTGWWRDRAGATTTLLGRLDGLRATTTRDPRGGVWVIAGVVAVLEGAAADAAEPGWVDVVRTARGGQTGGDDLVVSTAARMLGQGEPVVAVTADRQLRARLAGLSRPADGPGPRILGPNWLWSLLDPSSGSR